MKDIKKLELGNQTDLIWDNSFGWSWAGASDWVNGVLL